MAIQERTPLSELPQVALPKSGSHLRSLWYLLLGTAPGLFLAPFLHSDVLWDIDSSRLKASVEWVSERGARHLLESQEVLLPHLIYRPALSGEELGTARLVPLLSLIVLLGLIGLIAGRITQSSTASLVSGMAFTSYAVFTGISTRLPLYLLMLALGYGGMILLSRAVTTERWTPLLLPAALLVLSSEAHGIGQLFLAAPLLFLIAEPRRETLMRLARFYLLMIPMLIPRLLINLAVGGLAHIRTNRADFFVTKGYLDLINANFWEHPASAFSSHAEYAAVSIGRLAGAIGWEGFLSFALAVIFFVRASNKNRILASGALLGLLAALLLTKPLPSTRYFAPLLPGLAIMSGIGAVELSRLTRAPRTIAFSVVSSVALVALGAGLLTATTGRLLDESVKNGPLPAIARWIDNDKLVIGARSVNIHAVSRGITTLDPEFMTETDLLTYLTWPSNEEVFQMFERNDIGWIILDAHWALETDYHQAWVGPTYGLQVRHVHQIWPNDNLCLVGRAYFHQLFRVGTCPPGHEVMFVPNWRFGDKIQ